MSGKAATINLTEKQLSVLQRIERSTTAAARLIQRVRISGATAKFSANEVTLILALACEPPCKSGRPIERWTYREVADETMKRKIVPSISVSQIWRLLSEAQLQPHRSKYWLNTTEKDPRVFEQQVSAVCNCYLDAPILYSQQNTHTVSVDEMTGIQALERNARSERNVGVRRRQPQYAQ